MNIQIYLEKQEYIALCDVLKLSGICDSGGQAKALIAEGLVRRNGIIETRKTAKIRSGEMIQFAEYSLEIRDGSPEN